MNPNKKNTFEKSASVLLVIFILVVFGVSYKTLIHTNIPIQQNSAGAGNAGGNTLLVAPGEKLILTGGFGGAAGFREVYSATNPAVWSPNPTPAWTGRYQHQTIFYKGKLWLMGGFASPGGFSNDISSSLDGVTWTPPVAAPWSKRSQFGMVVFNNKLYVLGGTGAAGNLRDVWEFDGSVWTPRGNMGGSPRTMHGAVVFNDGGGDRIYVLGGSTNAAPIANDVWSWNGPSSSWIQKTTTMLPYVTGASDPEFVVYDNGTGSKIYRLGQTINSTNTGNANVWSSVNGITWVEQPWAAWGGKKALESVVYNDGTGKKLYVLGGSSIIPLGQIREVWKATNPDVAAGWSLVTATPGWVSRLGHSVAVLPLKPDLVITSIQWSDTFGAAPNNLPIAHSNDPYIYFTFIIKNIGTADATLPVSFPPFELSMDTVPQALSIPPFLLTSPASVITLAPGQSYTFNNIPNSSASTMRANVGSYVLTGFVDSHMPGSVDELSETNNTATATLVIN